MKFRLTAAALAVAVTLGACERETKTVVATPPSGTSITTQLENTVAAAGAVVDDATITAKVKTALLADDRVKGMAIDVDTKDNVVTLNGNVPNADVREQAVRIAKGIEGVKDVRSNLAGGDKGAAADVQFSEPIQHLQKAAQRLRESIQAMAQEQPGPRRNQAIKDAQDAILQANQAMAQLPAELREGTPGGATGSTPSAGASASTGSSVDSSKAMDRLQKAAQELRESAQDMAQQPAGPRRNDAIRTVNRALLEVNSAMTQLPPEMRAAR